MFFWWTCVCLVFHFGGGMGWGVCVGVWVWLAGGEVGRDVCVCVCVCVCVRVCVCEGVGSFACKWHSQVKLQHTDGLQSETHRPKGGYQLGRLERLGLEAVRVHVCCILTRVVLCARLLFILPLSLVLLPGMIGAPSVGKNAHEWRFRSPSDVRPLLAFTIYMYFKCKSIQSKWYVNTYMSPRGRPIGLTHDNRSAALCHNTSSTKGTARSQRDTCIVNSWRRRLDVWVLELWSVFESRSERSRCKRTSNSPVVELCGKLSVIIANKHGKMIHNKKINKNTKLQILQFCFSNLGAKLQIL